MTIQRKLFICALLAASTLAPLATASAQHISVELGDRPYYTHGDSYWRGHTRYVWIPGHRSHRGGWVPGHYAAREHRSPMEELRRRHLEHRETILGY